MWFEDRISFRLCCFIGMHLNCFTLQLHLSRYKKEWISHNNKAWENARDIESNLIAVAKQSRSNADVFARVVCKPFHRTFLICNIVEYTFFISYILHLGVLIVLSALLFFFPYFYLVKNEQGRYVWLRIRWFRYIKNEFDFLLVPFFLVNLTRTYMINRINILSSVC